MLDGASMSELLCNEIVEDEEADVVEIAQVVWLELVARLQAALHDILADALECLVGQRLRRAVADGVGHRSPGGFVRIHEAAGVDLESKRIIGQLFINFPQFIRFSLEPDAA